MDSITQAVLGSALARVSLPQLPRSTALIIGAAYGTLPDLDVLYTGWLSDVDSFTLHRSASHSLITLPIFAAICATVMYKLSAQNRFGLGNATSITWQRWYISIALILCTHPLLDSLTTYGTQLLWPVSDFPFATSSMFIVDPLYTLPLLIVFFWKNATQQSYKLVLAVTTGYLLVSVLFQKQMHDSFSRYVQEQPPLVTPDNPRILVQAGPFTTLYWRGLYVTDSGYAVATIPIWQQWSHAEWFRRYNDRDSQEVIQAVSDHPQFNRLARFAQGIYLVDRYADDWVYNDLRMGAEERDLAYLFRFEIATINHDGSIRVNRDFSRYDSLLR